MKIKKLKINPKVLRKFIELKSEYWLNKDSTNCYAYALGLDIPERNIMDGAYRLGTIGLLKEEIDPCFLLYYSKEARLEKDLKAFKLKYEEVDPNERIEDTNKYSHFLISLFERDGDFHFLRKSKLDNTWWHKQGWNSAPKNTDDNNEVITDPRSAKIDDYKYLKTYKIRFKRS